ncbi:unnamed protein product [Allacma fusca]|uniref:Uncharacterized protein n=1 Tax=Allacma fusca TaxID=39272 RepID=A0A8J2L9S6_9HEXA|nr:unnamed protein product [Allacma fusca]
MFRQILFVSVVLLVHSTCDWVQKSKELYIEDWVEYFSACRIEIYTDSLTELAFFHQKESNLYPVVLSTKTAVYPENKVCSLHRHIEQCHANMFLPYAERKIDKLASSSEGFTKSYIPAVQHYHIFTHTFNIQREMDEWLKLKTEPQERAEFTHVIFFSLLEKYDVEQYLIKVKFSYFATACFACPACPKKNIRQFYKETEAIPHRESKWHPDFSDFHKTRRELLKTVPHGIRLFEEKILLNYISVQLTKVPDALDDFIKIIQSHFSNSSLLLSHPQHQSPPEAYLARSIKTLPNIYYKKAFVSFSDIVPVQIRFFNFITCVLPEENIVISVFLDPFDLNLWIGLGISCLVFIGIFWRLAGTKSTFLDSLLLVISLLLENCQIPSFLQKRGVIRSMIGMCLIFSIIVENSYKGKITSSVTAPKFKKPLENFDDLEGFKLYGPIATSFQRFTTNEKSWRMIIDHKGLKSIFKDPELDNNRPCLTLFGWQMCLQYASLRHVSKQGHQTKLHSAITRARKIMLMLATPKDFPNVSIEQEVCKCNKSVFVDTNDNLDAFVPHFTGNRNKIFTKGSEQFLHVSIGWAFQNEKKSGGLLSKFIRVWISESGMYRWMEFKLPPVKRNSIKYLMEIQKTTAKALPLSWSSNLISGLLYISLCCLGICWIALLVEKIVKKCLVFRTMKPNKINFLSGGDFSFVQVKPRTKNYYY